MSRPRSGRAATSAATSRTPAGRPGVFVQTPRSDIYVAMLGVALGAMFIGIVLLLLIWKRYDFKKTVSSLDNPALSALAWLPEKSHNLVTVRL